MKAASFFIAGLAVAILSIAPAMRCVITLSTFSDFARPRIAPPFQLTLFVPARQRRLVWLQQSGVQELTDRAKNNG